MARSSWFRILAAVGGLLALGVLLPNLLIWLVDDGSSPRPIVPQLELFVPEGEDGDERTFRTSSDPARAPLRVSRDPLGLRGVLASPESRPGAVEFHGRVLDPEGRPLAGAAVHLDLEDADGLIRHVTFAPQGSWDSSSATPPARTGEDGRFSWTLDPGRAWRVLAIVEHPDYAYGFAPRPLGGVERELAFGDLQLERGGSFSGRVLRRVGGAVEPLADVEVRVVPAEGSGSADRRRWAIVLGTWRTDGNGDFLATRLPAGSWRIGVSHPSQLRGGWEDVQVLRRGERRDLGSVELMPGLTLRGRVFDPAGRPVAGASVRVANAERLGVAGRVQIRELASTGSDGSFSVPHLPNHPVSLAVASEGFRTWRRPQLAVGQEPLVVRLAAGASVRVRVLDPKGETVDSAAVVVRPVVGASELEDVRPWRVPEDLGAPVRIPVDGLAWHGLDDGPHVVDAVVPGVGYGRSDVFEVRGGAVTSALQTVRLRPVTTLAVLVTTSEGRPVPGAAASLSVELPEDPLGLQRAGGLSLVHTGTTEGARGVELGPIVPGDYVAEVRAPGFAKSSQRLALPEDAPDGVLRVTLSGGARVAGLVRGVNRPARIRTVRVVAWRDPDPVESRRLVEVVRLATDRSFEFDSLVPGTWHFGACLGPAAEFLASHAEGDAEQIEVRALEAGDARRVELEIAETRLVTLRGRVSIDGPATLPALEIELIPAAPAGEGSGVALRPRTRRVPVGSDGTFEFVDVPAGRGQVLRLASVEGRRVVATRSVDVDPRDALPVSWQVALGALRVRAVGAVRVRVVPGATDPGLEWTDWQRAGGVVWHQSMRSAGGVLFDPAPAGSALVRAEWPDGAVRTRVVRIAPGSAALELELSR